MKDRLDLIFSALADPTRRTILTTLSSGDAHVSELAGPFLDKMSLPAITKHLNVLEKAGLIIKTKDAQYRTCKINKGPLDEAVNWMDQCRDVLNDSFDRMDEYLIGLQKNKK